MAGFKLTDSKGNQYDEDQIAALMEILNAPGKPINWGRAAGQAVGKTLNLRRELEALKEAGRKVMAARDKDSLPYGDPGHCHATPGVWDRDGSVCLDCAAYNDLAALCGKA